MFNTNTLGYKLVSDQLKTRRKHSEQLNKYVAGLFDSDGCVSLEFNSNGVGVSIRSSITAAASVDQDFEMLRSLNRFYNIGKLKYSIGKSGTSRCDWYMSTKDSSKFFNLIGKHMRIKGTHFRNCIDLQDKYRGSVLTDDLKDHLRNVREESRRTSTWLKRPKHLSYAWVAGYFDGDGSYGFRKKYNTLDIRVPSQDLHILYKLKEDFGGTIHTPKEGNYKMWTRGLGKGNISFSLPFLKKMRMYSCIERKYNKIQEMITYLESKRVAETKQERHESVSDSPISIT